MHIHTSYGTYDKEKIGTKHGSAVLENNVSRSRSFWLPVLETMTVPHAAIESQISELPNRGFLRSENPTIMLPLEG